jgi:hypothetical protein
MGFPEKRAPATKKHHNLGDSLAIIALVVAALTWAFAPNFIAKSVAVFFSTALLIYLSYRSYFVRDWPNWSRHIAAVIMLFAVPAVALLQLLPQWRAEHTGEVAPTQSAPPLYFSLQQLTSEKSLAFLKEPLRPGESFYHFRVSSGMGDSNISIALDLPALLSRDPILIAHSGADDLNVAAEVSEYTRSSEGRTERVKSRFGNGVTIEMSRLWSPGFVDVGIVTAPIKQGQIVLATAPDGSIVMSVAPIYGRFGSLSMMHRTIGGGGERNARSYPITYPMPGRELIDYTNELSPWSRTQLQPFTKDELLRADRAGIHISFEIPYQVLSLH